MDSDQRHSVVRWTLFVGAIVGLVLLFYLAITGFLALRALEQAKTSLAAAEKVVVDNPDQAGQSFDEAQTSAQSAYATFHNPVWRAVSAVPYLGATPKAAGVITQSLTQTLDALEPALQTLQSLNPSRLVQDGRISITPVQEAVPTAEEALPGLQRAQQTLSTMPEGGLLLAQVTEAGDQLARQVNTAETTLEAAATFGKVAGPLLGQEGKRRYFVGILNPNETRGTGGFLGTYGILTADNGTITVDEIGSNSDIPSLSAYPASIDAQFRNRYGNDALLTGNMNLSPHFPDTANLWLAAWQQKTGERLDGAIALDIVSLGQLVAATGKPLTLPDGTMLNGQQLTQFTLRDIYAQFPDAGVRKEYQEEIARSGLTEVTALPKPAAMAEAFGRGFSEGRIVVWSSDAQAEKQLEAAGISGSIAVSGGHTVKAVLINASGSKLDAWLTRGVTYQVGRCPVDGRVDSAVTVNVRSDVPLGERPPPYMVGQANSVANGPVNFSLLQMHLPKGAEVTSVTLDGADVGRFTFEEQNRPSVLVALELPPRVTKRVRVGFTEPASNGPGVITDQPLASAPTNVVMDEGCG